MSITIKDVARKASVSTATVSLALKGDPRVAKATRALVEKVAREMRYVPSNLGRALQSSRSRLVGYILSDVTQSFYSELVQGIGEKATARGYGLLVGITDGSRERESQLLRLFREKSVDGLLVSAWCPESVRELLDCDRGGLPAQEDRGAGPVRHGAGSAPCPAVPGPAHRRGRVLGFHGDRGEARGREGGPAGSAGFVGHRF